VVDVELLVKYFTVSYKNIAQLNKTTMLQYFSMKMETIRT